LQRRTDRSAQYGFAHCALPAWHNWTGVLLIADGVILLALP
jgi:hypothetical protein